MKHLDAATTLAMIIIILLPTAGCSESTSRARDTRSLASEPAAPIAAAHTEQVAFPAAAGGEILSTFVGAAAESAPAEQADTTISDTVRRTPVEATPTEEGTTAADLELRRLVMARGIENHEPVGSAETFVHDGTALFAFMQIANPGSEDRQIVIRYQHESGQEVGPVQLHVPAGSRGWRTFTRTYWVRHPGAWTVSVETADGRLLGQSQFTVRS